MKQKVKGQEKRRLREEKREDKQREEARQEKRQDEEREDEEKMKGRMKEKMKRIEKKEKMIFFKKKKNVSRPSNPPDELAQNVSKKIPVGRIIPPFFLQKFRIWPFFNYLHDSNSIFWAQGMKSEIFSGCTVSGGPGILGLMGQMGLRVTCR